jgi:hypothetical protein
MSTDLKPSSTAVEDRAPYRMVSPVLRPADKTAAVTKVRYLERDLLDDSGHVRKGVTLARAAEIVAEINDLRQVLGWLQIDLDGRWRWPARGPGNRVGRGSGDLVNECEQHDLP